MVSRTSAAKQPQLNIMGYYTQSAAIRAARGDSIATPAVSLEHGRGRLKDRSQGAPASYEGSRFLRECGGLKPRSTKPPRPATGQPPRPPDHRPSPLYGFQDSPCGISGIGFT